MSSTPWREELALAFPSRLAEEVFRVQAVLAEPLIRPAGVIEVRISGEPLRIPYRIYSPEPRKNDVRGLSPAGVAILNALLTRHHDGHVRERHLVEIIELDEDWIPRYIVQLLGEYVIEIHVLIHGRLGALLSTNESARGKYRSFISENPNFVDSTARRVISYWNCYYRADYPRRLPTGVEGKILGTDYPALLMMKRLRSL